MQKYEKPELEIIDTTPQRICDVVDMPFKKWLEKIDATCICTLRIVTDLKKFNRNTEKMLMGKSRQRLEQISPAKIRLIVCYN